MLPGCCLGESAKHVRNQNPKDTVSCHHRQWQRQASVSVVYGHVVTQRCCQRFGAPVKSARGTCGHLVLQGTTIDLVVNTMVNKKRLEPSSEGLIIPVADLSIFRGYGVLSCNPIFILTKHPTISSLHRSLRMRAASPAILDGWRVRLGWQACSSCTQSGNRHCFRLVAACGSRQASTLLATMHNRIPDLPADTHMYERVVSRALSRTV